MNVLSLGQPVRIMPDPTRGYTNSGPLAGAVRFWNPEKRLPCNEPPWGQLVAVNVNTGEIAWRSTLGVSDNLPHGYQHTGRPGFGGPTLTASGLTFIAATDDARFRAYETKSGKELWSYRLPASAESIPITYADVHGKQLVAIVSTGGGLLRTPLLSDEVIAFTLDDGSKSAPNIVQASPGVNDPPAQANSSITAAEPIASLHMGQEGTALPRELENHLGSLVPVFPRRRILG